MVDVLYNFPYLNARLTHQEGEGRMQGRNTCSSVSITKPLGTFEGSILRNVIDILQQHTKSHVNLSWPQTRPALDLPLFFSNHGMI